MTEDGLSSRKRVHNNRRLAELDRGHLDRLYHQRLAAGLSPTTVRHVQAILHRVLEQAVRWGVVARNVADLVDPPRRAQRDMRPLDAVQVRRLLDAAHGDRLEAIFVLAVTTGMRRGELLALRWRGVDLDGASLSVTGTLHQTPSGLVVAEPKTPRSRRRIDLTPTAVAALRRHRTAQLEERLLAGSLWQEGGFVFTNVVGRAVDPGNLLLRAFAPLLTRAGLPRMRFHDLRHTAATLMLTRGVHPKIVSEMLGHATIAITLDTYSHVLPTMQQAAARAMEDVLTGG